MLRLASGLMLVALTALPAFTQEPSHQDQMLAKIEARRMEIRHHTEVLESIDDPDMLQREMQVHFLMTEELLAWIGEHQSHRLAAETAATQNEAAAEAVSEGAAGGMGRKMGMKGMDRGKKMGMGMMGMSGMGAMGNGDGDEGGEKGTSSSNSHSGTGSATGAASAAASRIAEREAMLQEISTHTLYLQSIKDPRERATENVKHQLMLERLMEKMQQ